MKTTNQASTVQVCPSAEVVMSGVAVAERVAASVNRLHDYKVVFSQGKVIRSGEMGPLQLQWLVSQIC